jgi:membrane fusion protein
MQKMRQLFRQEAIDAQREKLLGAVSSARPVPMRVFTAIAAAFAITLIVFAFWGEYTRRERVEGFLALDVGAARVLAPMPAIVDELFVKEGAEVDEGAPIAKLTLTAQVGRMPQAELEEQMRGIEAEIAGAKQQAKQEEAQVRGRITTYLAELKQIDAESDLQKARVKVAQDEANRMAKLVTDGFYSASEGIKKQNELLGERAKLTALDRQRTTIDRDLGIARSELGGIQVKLNQKLSQLERKRSELRVLAKTEDTRGSAEIRAPTKGVVTNIAVARGDSLAADAPIAMVVPKGGLRAQLLVPTRASGFIAPGNNVVMRYDAFPFQRFGQYGGKVDVVSGTVWSPGEKVGPMIVREPVYRVDVKLDRQTVMAGGQELALRPGMVLSADILLEKRSVFEWVFEPVLELRGRL